MYNPSFHPLLHQHFRTRNQAVSIYWNLKKQKGICGDDELVHQEIKDITDSVPWFFTHEPSARRHY